MHRPDGSGPVTLKLSDAQQAGSRRRCECNAVEGSHAKIGLLACCSVLAGAALAFDNGQYENVPADIRAWFKSVIAPSGVPCCDISDGHRTEYDFREGAYWVPIE